MHKIVNIKSLSNIFSPACNACKLICVYVINFDI